MNPYPNSRAKRSTWAWSCSPDAPFQSRTPVQADLRQPHPLPENQGTPLPLQRPAYRHHAMRRARRGPLSGARFHRPMPDRFRTRLAHARRLRLARPRCGVRTCADPGCSTPTLEGRHRMTDPRRTWEKAFLANRRQRRAIQQRGHSATSRLPAGVCREHKEHGQRLPHPATAASQGGAPTMAVARHCHPSECHLGRDYRRSSTPPACGPRPCSVLRHALRRQCRPGAESPAGQLRTLQRRVRQLRMVMARLLIYGNPDDAQPWEISVIGAEPGTNAQVSIRKSGEVTQRDRTLNCTSVSPEALVLSNHSPRP